MAYFVIRDCEIIKECDTLEVAKMFKTKWSKIFKGEFIEE